MWGIILWPVVALVLGGITIWRGERLLVRYLRLKEKSYELEDAENQLRLQNQQVQLFIAEETKVEAAELKKAQLLKQTAETRQATELLDGLTQARLDAERQAIEAQAAAEEDLAEEFVRAQHEQELAQVDLVAEYERYLAVANKAGKSGYDFGDFASTLRSWL